MCVFFSLFPLTSLMFNSCDNEQVSFIPGCHRLMPVLADYPSSSVTARQNIMAIIPVYNLGHGSVNPL